MKSVIGRLLGNPELDRFACSLAEELARRYPPELEARRNRKNEKRLARALDFITNEARAYRRSRRPGVYRKARIGNTLKWELRERGYREEVVDAATRSVVLGLARD